jgi:cyanate permease
MMASRTASTHSQVFQETKYISSLGIQITFSISLATLSGFAAGRSILFSTGIISKSWSIAWYSVESVCAWIHWLASTSKIAHSTAASERETSYWKST